MDREIINFKIERMDGFGQGISYTGGNTVFIEKVLPGESGTAAIYRKAKGVLFAQVEEITVESKMRKQSLCSMFYQCGGCQYLHTSYENEIFFKRSYLERIFLPLLPENAVIKTYPAYSRSGYRNRVQLHYNTGTGELGYISKFTPQFIPADSCILPAASVTRSIKRLYRNGYWKTLISSSSPEKGTIEIYQHDSKNTPDISVNASYAEGGFSQINNTMNHILTSLVTKAFSRHFEKTEHIQVLDIFGGDGNLTENLPGVQATIVDVFPGKRKKSSKNSSRIFHAADLYKKNAVEKLYGDLPVFHHSPPHLLVFDPPRKGIKNSETWIKYFPAKIIFYISCNPSTLKRDAMALRKYYTLTEIHLVDLFPGTKHFETFAVFKKRDHRQTGQHLV